MQLLCLQALSTVGILGVEQRRRSLSSSLGSGGDEEEVNEDIQSMLRLRSAMLGSLSVAANAADRGNRTVNLRLRSVLQQVCGDDDTMPADKGVVSWEADTIVDVEEGRPVEEDSPELRRLLLSQRKASRWWQLAFVEHSLWFFCPIKKTLSFLCWTVSLLLLLHS